MTAAVEVEEWRVTLRHDRYEVSSLGRVRNRKTGRVLKPQRHDKGYLKVKLGRKIHVYVHQLVCECWHGPGPAGFEVDHEDFNRANNTPGNLRWLKGVDNWNRHQRFAMAEPEDHVPMTAAEIAELDEHLDQASGW